MSAETSNQANAPPRLILASASPRRAALLRELGYDFEVVVSAHKEPETPVDPLSPAAVAEALSYYKARSVALVRPTGLILAGDTVVTYFGRLFGKPVDRADARRIIQTLAGTTHHVITGVTLLDPATSRRAIRHDVTAVTMRPMSEDEVEGYLATGAWEGKAGAYGIQDEADAFVTQVDGSFSNVVGFPLELIGAMLAKWGLTPAGRLP